MFCGLLLPKFGRDPLRRAPSGALRTAVGTCHGAPRVAPWYALLVSLTLGRLHRQRSAERLGANPRARLGLLAHFQRRRLRDRWTVRAFRPGSYGCSTSRMLPELAMMMLFRFLVSLEPIVKRCDSALVPVPSAAPRRGVCGIAYGTSRSSVRTESIREHDSIVTGIGAEHADATSALSDAFPVSEGARPYLCRGRFQRAQKCSWTVHAFPAEPYGRSLSSML